MTTLIRSLSKEGGLTRQEERRGRGRRLNPGGRALSSPRAYLHWPEWLAHQLEQDVKRPVFKSLHPGPEPPAQTWQVQMKSMAGAGVGLDATVAARRAAASKSFLIIVSFS